MRLDDCRRSFGVTAARVAAALVVVVFGLMACASADGIVAKAHLREPDSLGLSTTAGAPIALEETWWHEFGDPQLDQLVAQALLQSPTLKLMQARLMRAQAGVDAVDAASGPQLTAGLDATHQQYTANGAIPPPLAGAVRDSATAQLTASWELDFFGKNRAALQAALGHVRAAQAETLATRMTLAAGVVRGYLQLARLNEQLVLARQVLNQRERTLQLVQDRVNAGLDSRLELHQSEAALPETRQQIEALQEQLTLAGQGLNALLGLPAPKLNLNLPALADLKTPPLAATMPADLLARRPDIAAARWRVEAALQDVRGARAQFYPNINLSAFAGFSSIGLDRLLSTGSEQWGVGPALRLPLFDGGRLRANLQGKTADLDAAIESYNSSVIEAVREVADQLESTQAIQRQQAQQIAAQSLAEQAHDLALQRYEAGLGNYLQVLASEASVLQQRRLGVDLAARRLDTQLALMRALGGGYHADFSTLAEPVANQTAF